MTKPKTTKPEEAGSSTEAGEAKAAETTPSELMGRLEKQNEMLLAALGDMRGELDALKAAGPVVGSSDRDQTVAGIAAIMRELEARDRPVTGGKGAPNGLVTVTFLQKWKRGRYQAGDSAGVPPAVAQRLVNAGAATLTLLAEVGFNQDYRNFRAGDKATITKKLAKELAEDGTVTFIDGPLKRAASAVVEAVTGNE